MFKSINDYEYACFIYSGRTFIIISKRRITEVTFVTEFFAVAECINMFVEQEKLPILALEAIKKCDVEKTFIKDTLLNKDGIMFVFNQENKELVKYFFTSIPFFI